jgi:hypothetical protein
MPVRARNPRTNPRPARSFGRQDARRFRRACWRVGRETSRSSRYVHKERSGVDEATTRRSPSTRRNRFHSAARSDRSDSQLSSATSSSTSPTTCAWRTMPRAGRRDPNPRMSPKCAAAQHDHTGRVVAFESPHRAQPSLQAAMVGLDPIVRALARLVERAGMSSATTATSVQARSVITSVGLP